MTLLHNAKRYFSWRLSVMDAPRLVDFVSGCMSSGDFTITKRYRNVLNSVSTDPSNPFMDESYLQVFTRQEIYGDGGWRFGLLNGYFYDPVQSFTADVIDSRHAAATTTPAITPLQGEVVGFQTDYDQCVIYREGALVYEGEYDGRAFPLMFNYKDRDIYTKDNCWIESHQVRTPRRDKTGKFVWQLFDDIIPSKPDANGQPMPIKRLGVNGWSAAQIECMEQHYANSDVETDPENTNGFHSPVPMLADRSETIYLYGEQWERRTCDICCCTRTTRR